MSHQGSDFQAKSVSYREKKSLGKWQRNGSQYSGHWEQLEVYSREGGHTLRESNPLEANVLSLSWLLFLQQLPNMCPADSSELGG